MEKIRYKIKKEKEKASTVIRAADIPLKNMLHNKQLLGNFSDIQNSLQTTNFCLGNFVTAS